MSGRELRYKSDCSRLKVFFKIDLGGLEEEIGEEGCCPGELSESSLKDDRKALGLADGL